MASYSLEQLHRYFNRIGLPQVDRQSSVAQKDEKVALQFLELLQRYQLAAVPFENLILHYSAHRTISIDHEQVFDKIVNNASRRGGYCMENSTLFGTVLRTLGYNVTPVGGRVNEAVQPMAASKSWKGPTYNGWNHMVNIVTIGDHQYLIDVGFGSNGPHRPVPLLENFEFHNTGDQCGRLVYAPIAQHTSKGQFVWQYEIRNGAKNAWTPAYCFTGTEFIPEDFEIINYYMSSNRASWFTFHVVCVRMILDEKNEVIGDLTLFNNTLKRRTGATSEVLESFTSEEERVAALEKYFQIYFPRVEREGIRYTISEII
ncbi:arylamine N-acetyltransferase 2 [Penicillium maclennaniae]|uniref:arylamine N-acetyltransferase 2 n=1 Tax=Penicillium maclennaniae TaxID=1343394 RepID=UPI002541A5F0|nr:arylamine N-acetyltransferase 2 [Penicillium maclennaniae]KAJ5674494.1 arylamine N-acetyltransferase 2 [Penicillium maclennaniae]